MNRIQLGLLLILFCAGSAPLAGEGLPPKIYPVDSPLYELLATLSVEQGLALPSSAGPWSRQELELMFSRIRPGELSADALQQYQHLKRLLETPLRKGAEGTFSYQGNLTASAEAYLHSSADTAFDEEDEWIEGPQERSSLLNTSLEFTGADLLYGRLELDLRNNRFYTDTSSTAGFYGPPATTNLIFDRTANNIDMSFPWTAFLAAGGDHWSAQFGRDRISWGSGISGNLVLADHLIYHDALRYTAFYEPFKYTFALISFPHPDMYQKPPHWDDGEGEWFPMTEISAVRSFIGHRFEFQAARNLRFSISESIMFQGGTYDLRLLSPFVILHNFYLRSTMNSILGIEVDYTPVPSLLVHLQAAVDEAALGIESLDDPASQPNAVGILGSLQYRRTFGAGLFRAAAEGVYTTPYLYLRDSGGIDPDSPDYASSQPIDFVVGYQQYTQEMGLLLKKEFLGYRWGGDAVTATLLGEFTIPNRGSIYGRLFWMAHGTYDADSLYAVGPQAVAVQTPSSSELKGSGEKNGVETTFAVSAGGSFQAAEQVSIRGNLHWVLRRNPGNVSAPDPKYDIQAAFGVRYSLRND